MGAQASKPKPVAEPGCHYLLVGNPGRGKSTILNGLLGRVAFKSGISIGPGLTQVFHIVKEHEAFYLDTPGLSDPVIRKKAAAEISKALRQNGRYRVFFASTLDIGRVIDADVATMKLVLDAAPIADFGIILNMLDKEVVKQLSVGGYHIVKDMFEKLLGRKDFRMHVVQEMQDLKGRDDKILQVDDKLREFIYGLPDQHISASEVRHVSTETYESLKEELELMRTSYQSLEEVVVELRAIIEEHRRKAEHAREEADTLKQQVAAQVASFDALKQQIEQQNGATEEMQAKLDTAQKHIKDLEQEGADRQRIELAIAQRERIYLEFRQSQDEREAMQQRLRDMAKVIEDIKGRSEFWEQQANASEEAALKALWEKEAMHQRIEKMQQDMRDAKESNVQATICSPLREDASLQVDWSISEERVLQLFNETSGERYRPEMVDMIRNDLRFWVSSHMSVIHHRIRDSGVFNPALGVSDIATKELLLSRLQSWFETAGRSGAKLVLAWHGASSEAAMTGIAQFGFAALSTLDPGFFGRGRYITRESRYACRYATGEIGSEMEKRELYPVILVAGVIGSAYPITQCTVDFKDLPVRQAQSCKYFGQPMRPKFDTHIIAVDAHNGYNCASQAALEENGSNILHEVVFDQDAQLLPLAVVWFMKR